MLGVAVVFHPAVVVVVVMVVGVLWSFWFCPQKLLLFFLSLAFFNSVLLIWGGWGLLV